MEFAGSDSAERGPKSKRNRWMRSPKTSPSECTSHEDLRKAHIIIDVQKKWLRCWGIHPEPDPEEKS